MAFPSTFQDIQNAVIAKGRLDATNDLSRVKDWINQVYADACVQTEFVRATAQTAALTAAATSAAIPAAAVRIKQVQSKLAAGAYGPPMQRIPLDRILYYRDLSAVNAQPTHFAIVQSNIEFWPPAPANAVIQFWYVARPTALSANGDTPVIDEPYASKVLEYGALAEAADYLNDYMSSYTYRQVYAQWMQELQRHIWSLRGGDQPPVRPMPGLNPQDQLVDVSA